MQQALQLIVRSYPVDCDFESNTHRRTNAPDSTMDRVRLERIGRQR